MQARGAPKRTGGAPKYAREASKGAEGGRRRSKEYLVTPLIISFSDTHNEMFRYYSSKHAQSIISTIQSFAFITIITLNVGVHVN